MFPSYRNQSVDLRGVCTICMDHSKFEESAIISYSNSIKRNYLSHQCDIVKTVVHKKKKQGHGTITKK